MPSLFQMCLLYNIYLTCICRKWQQIIKTQMFTNRKISSHIQNKKHILIKEQDGHAINTLCSFHLRAKIPRGQIKVIIDTDLIV